MNVVISVLKSKSVSHGHHFVRVGGRRHGREAVSPAKGLQWCIPKSHRWLGDELTVVVVVADVGDDAVVIVAAGRAVGSAEMSAVAHP